MATDLHPDVVRAIHDLSKTKLGRRFDRYAEKNYGIHGRTLAARQTAGEFGGRSTRTGRGVVSSAGARGPAQFIKSTRDEFVQRYGIDPWKDDKSAMKGLMIHDLKTGVAGYNPGDPNYTNYVLGQRIKKSDRKALRRGGGAGGGSMTLQGAKRTEVGIKTETIPGQSFAAERDAARQQLLLGGHLDLKTLLKYKSQLNSLQDIPDRKVATGDLKVKTTQGPGVKVNFKHAQPAAGHAGHRTVTYDGKPVVAWIAHELAKAKKTGLWHGSVTSGERTKSQQMSAAKGFGLQHYGSAGPLGSNHVIGHDGAVDVSDPDGLAKALKAIGSPLHRGMADDPVHFSRTGH